MELRSTFTYRVIFVFLAIVGAGFPLYMFATEFIFQDPTYIPLYLLILLFVLIMLFFLLELRNRATKVTITGEGIRSRGLLGLAPARSYYFLELDGYITCMLPSKYNTYEYLFIMKNGRRVITISEFYHSNYLELKHALSSKLTDQGEEEFSFLKEFRKMLRR